MQNGQGALEMMNNVHRRAEEQKEENYQGNEEGSDKVPWRGTNVVLQPLTMIRPSALKRPFKLLAWFGDACGVASSLAVYFMTISSLCRYLFR